MLAVEQAVSGEMDDPIPAEIRTERHRAVCREIQSFKAPLRAGQRRDLISLAAAEYQPLEPLLLVGCADFKSGPEDLALSGRTGILFVVLRRDIAAALSDSLVGPFEYRIGEHRDNLRRRSATGKVASQQAKLDADGR